MQANDEPNCPATAGNTSVPLALESRKRQSVSGGGSSGGGREAVQGCAGNQFTHFNVAPAPA